MGTRCGLLSFLLFCYCAYIPDDNCSNAIKDFLICLMVALSRPPLGHMGKQHSRKHSSNLPDYSKENIDVL